MFQSGICFNCGYDISLTTLEQKRQKDKINDEKQKEFQKRKLLKELEIQKDIENMLLTTTPQIDGYKVVEQLGIVFGDTIFKPSFTNRVSASIDDFSDIVSFGDKQLSGSTGLLVTAREYDIQKMKIEALKRGANAIIGIDSEGVFGADICHVTIVGTEAKIEKIV